MGGVSSLFEETDWKKADGKIANHDETIDGAPPSSSYEVYTLTKRATVGMGGQRDYDVTDQNSNLLYTTRAVPGTVAWFDVLGRGMNDYLLRVQVDLSRRFWVVYSYGIPAFAGQLSDAFATEKASRTLSKNGEDNVGTPFLYHKACITVSWARFEALVAFYGPPPLPIENSSQETKGDDEEEEASFLTVSDEIKMENDSTTSQQQEIEEEEEEQRRESSDEREEKEKDEQNDSDEPTTEEITDESNNTVENGPPELETRTLNDQEEKSNQTKELEQEEKDENTSFGGSNKVAAHVDVVQNVEETLTPNKPKGIGDDQQLEAISDNFDREVAASSGTFMDSNTQDTQQIELEAARNEHVDDDGRQIMESTLDGERRRDSSTSSWTGSEIDAPSKTSSSSSRFAGFFRRKSSSNNAKESVVALDVDKTTKDLESDQQQKAKRSECETSVDETEQDPDNAGSSTIGDKDRDQVKSTVPEGVASSGTITGIPYRKSVSWTGPETAIDAPPRQQSSRFAGFFKRKSDNKSQSASTATPEKSIKSSQSCNSIKSLETSSKKGPSLRSSLSFASLKKLVQEPSAHSGNEPLLGVLQTHTPVLKVQEINSFTGQHQTVLPSPNDQETFDQETAASSENEDTQEKNDEKSNTSDDEQANTGDTQEKPGADLQNNGTPNVEQSPGAESVETARANETNADAIPCITSQNKDADHDIDNTKENNCVNGDKDSFEGKVRDPNADAETKVTKEHTQTDTKLQTNEPSSADSRETDGNAVSSIENSMEEDVDTKDSATLAEDASSMKDQPLVGFWSWENTLLVHKITMHVAKNSDVALHVVLAIVTNQLRYERNAGVAAAV